MEIIWGNRLKAGDYKYIEGFPHYVADDGDDNIRRWRSEQIVAQELKWRGDQAEAILDKYLAVADERRIRDDLIWPETAIPLCFQDGLRRRIAKAAPERGLVIYRLRSHRPSQPTAPPRVEQSRIIWFRSAIAVPGISAVIDPFGRIIKHSPSARKVSSMPRYRERCRTLPIRPSWRSHALWIIACRLTGRCQ